MLDTVTSTVNIAGIMPKHRNMFRFPDGPVRLGVSSRPMPRKENWLRRFLRLDKPPKAVSMVSLSEYEFDRLDITKKGQPRAFCMLAPGLAVCWPTADRNYVVTVTMGA